MVDDSRNAWTLSGAHEIAPGAGVYRIPLPLPSDALRAVNVYAIADGEQVVLVDSGWSLAESEALLTKCLDEIGYGLDDVREFLVTHVHRDHYTQAVAIRRVHGTPVALGEGERTTLDAIEQLIRTGERRPMERLQRAGAGPLIAALARAGDGVNDRIELGASGHLAVDGHRAAAADPHVAGDRDAGPHARARRLPRRGGRRAVRR